MKRSPVKATLAILLVIAVCFSMAGCGENTSQDIDANNTYEYDVIEDDVVVSDTVIYDKPIADDVILDSLVQDDNVYECEINDTINSTSVRMMVFDV